MFTSTLNKSSVALMSFNNLFRQWNSNRYKWKLLKSDLNYSNYLEKTKLVLTKRQHCIKAVN